MDYFEDLRKHSPTLFRVDHHGTSGRWYPHEDNLQSVFEALLICENLKDEGYGVRVVRQDTEEVVMDAPWQEEIDWGCNVPC